MVTRAGNSSTHSQDVLLSLKELTLMRDTSRHSKSHSHVVSTAPHTVNSFLPAPPPITNDLDTNPLVPGPMNEEEEDFDWDNMDQGGHDHAPIAPAAAAIAPEHDPHDPDH